MRLISIPRNEIINIVIYYYNNYIIIISIPLSHVKNAHTVQK